MRIAFTADQSDTNHGVKESMLDHSTIDEHDLIATITPGTKLNLEGTLDYLLNHAEDINALLLNRGAVLFRGFDIGNAQAFETCAENLGAKSFAYIGGDTPRSRIASNVWTSTDFPASETIALHNEMSYLPRWPARIFFFCETPAPVGGETSLASAKDIVEALPEHVVERFKKKGVTYIRNYHSSIPIGKKWQTVYQTDDRDEAEQLMRSQASEWTWLSDGGLTVKMRREALTTHPTTGNVVWFNQAEQSHPSALNIAVRRVLEDMLGRGHLPHECTYGDGDPLEEDVLDTIRRVLVRHKTFVQWEAGDFLMLDNIATMHGREPFHGQRTVLAYLSSQ